MHSSYLAPTFHRRRARTLTCVVCATLTSAATAQEKILEEVIVTSQKREQSIMEVPNSVAAISGEKIEKAGIETIEDLTAYVPNIHLTETGLSTQLRIRGIGSDNSQGFEQSVGLYVDGVHRARAQLFRAPIFDVERAEVMRGPQNTLFGKNSVAGALELISARPDEDLSGQLSASYEAEYGTQELSGYITGQLFEGFNARLAARWYDDPGFMENTFKNTDEPEQQEQSLRGSFDWAITDNLSALLILERNSFDVKGRAIEITQDLPNAGGLTYGQILASFNAGVTFDSELDFKRQVDAPEFSDNTMDSQTLILEYDFNGYTLTATSGALGYDYTENCDCDFTPANIFDLDMYEDYEQFSQEVRVASPLGQGVEWIAGAFYQQYEQNFSDNLNISNDSILLDVLALQNPALRALGGTGARRDFYQESEAWALFGEATIHFTHDLSLALGARYTEENKDSTKVVNVVDINNQNTPISTQPQAATMGTLYYSLFGTDTEQTPQQGFNVLTMQPYSRPMPGHNLDASREESEFMPSVTFMWDVNDDLMTYAKYSKGFKAGGFDPRSNNQEFFEFENENVDSWELGSKWVLAGGQGELNAAVYHTDYNDLQTSQFDGYVGFNVGNADAEVQGLELDGRWQLSERWLAGYGAAYLDFEYTDYTTGNCYYGETPGPNGYCDKTGQRAAYTPKWIFNGNLEYTRALTGALDFTGTLDAQWVGKQQVHNNLDPLGEMDAYTMLNMRLAIDAEHWGVALLGKNLLDEEIITYSSNAPLSESLFGTNTFYSVIRRPLTVALEGTVRF